MTPLSRFHEMMISLLSFLICARKKLRVRVRVRVCVCVRERERERERGSRREQMYFFARFFFSSTFPSKGRQTHYSSMREKGKPSTNDHDHKQGTGRKEVKKKNPQTPENATNYCHIQRSSHHKHITCRNFIRGKYRVQASISSLACTGIRISVVIFS